MPKRDLLRQDYSEYAAAELTDVIRERQRAERAVPTVSVAEALSGRRLLKIASNRNVTRVLFVSRDSTLLNPTLQSLDGYLDVSGLFAEVHILILRQGIAPPRPVLRVASNVWIYTAGAASWWRVIKTGLALVHDQLEFAGGFRPDLIVALDPFESAVTALMLARRYDRPTQLHIIENYFQPRFALLAAGNGLRRYLPRFTVPRFLSVRTRTEMMEKKLATQFSIPDLATLPRFQDYEALLDSNASIDLKAKYQPHIFFMLYIGRLDADCTLHTVLDGVRFALQNPRVGLIVLGDGPARGEFEKRARVLGVERQVIFETKVSDVLPYLRSAHLLLVGDTNTASEEIVLRAAAAGIPLVMSETEKRRDVFTDGEDAFLYQGGDVQTVANCVNDLLNDIPLRQQFIAAGRRIIRERFHSDPRQYQEAYRASIEQVFFVGDEQEGEESLEEGSKPTDKESEGG